MPTDRTTELIEHATYHAGMAYATLRELEILSGITAASNDGFVSGPRKDKTGKEPS